MLGNAKCEPVDLGSITNLLPLGITEVVSQHVVVVRRPPKRTGITIGVKGSAMLSVVWDGRPNLGFTIWSDVPLVVGRAGHTFLGSFAHIALPIIVARIPLAVLVIVGHLSEGRPVISRLS